MNAIHALMLAQAIDAERRHQAERRRHPFVEPEVRREAAHDEGSSRWFRFPRLVASRA